MLKQHQTILGAGKGNCFSTCIACLLELPVDEVPNFCGDNWGNDGEWFRAANRWLARFGLRYFEVDFGEWVGHELGLPDCYLIVCGPGPRDCDHATVWLGGEMIHDPHPSGMGLLKPKSVGLLVPTDPRKAIANG